jgi:hypothetical protein
MLVLLIMAIISVMCTDLISGYEMAQRSERAAREARACFRFARSLALTTGKKAKVVVSTTNGTLSVYWMSNGTAYDATPVSTGLVAGGQWVLTMASRDLLGTAITLNPATTTSFEYNPMGTCGQTGAVLFSCGGRQKSLVVASVGDPTVQ